MKEAAAKVMIALDKPDGAAALQLAAQLEGFGCWMKVGMELFYAAGPAVVQALKSRGFQVFLDVKMHDIPNTVRGGARSISRLGVDLFNVHAAGGKAMMAAALEGVRDAAAAGDIPYADGQQALPQVIAVTQLTSTSEEVLQREIGLPGTMQEAVIRYANLAREAGLAGVVASPLEVAAIKAACGASFLTVTPGIRPQGTDAGDQRRTMTPLEAIRTGTDYMVIGRPITAAPDPAQALNTILEEIIQ